MYLNTCTRSTKDVPQYLHLRYWGCTSIPAREHWGCTSGGVHVPCVYLLACQVRVTENDSGLCCCVCMCYVFRALINSLVCWFCTGALGIVLFQIYTHTTFFLSFFPPSFFPFSCVFPVWRWRHEEAGKKKKNCNRFINDESEHSHRSSSIFSRNKPFTLKKNWIQQERKKMVHITNEY